MRSKVTVVLLFLNVVLFAYIWFYDKPLIDERKTLEARRRVLGPEAATIEALTRTDRTGETVTIEKRVDSWWLTAPYEWPADPNAIAGITNTLQLLEHETSFPVAELAASGRSLADYGLADPAVTLQFTSAGRNYALKIGDVTAVGNRLYLLSPDGTRIHVVNRSLVESIGLPLDTLRAPAIFSVPVFEVRSLNMQTAAPANLKVRLRRDAAGRWAFEAPINARASKSAVEVTINAVNALTAKNFLEPRDTDLERAGLNAPAFRLTLEGNARRETLLLGNPTSTTATAGQGTDSTEYYAKLEDQAVVFTTVMPQALLAVLRAAQEELRDPRVLDFEPASVTSFTIGAPGQPELTLQKLEGEQGWQVVTRVNDQAPLPIAADPGVVAGLLKKLDELAAREARPGSPKFLSDAPAATDLETWGFNRPERVITLRLGHGGGPTGKDAYSLTLEVGVSPDKPGEAFARVTNAPFVYQILPDILDAAPALARHYRLRLLRQLPKEAHLTSLKLTTLPAHSLVVEAANETALTPESLATAKTSEAARKVLAGLLTQLTTLQARAFTAGQFTPDHADTPLGSQPWKHALEITTVFPGGSGAAQTSTLTLLLTERLGGTTMFAGTADFGGVVFEVTPEMLDAIFALTYTGQPDPGPPQAAAEPLPTKAAEAPAETPKTELPPKS